MEYFYKNHLIINLIYLISMSHRGMVLESAGKKYLKSIDYMRQKVWSKNLKYKFYRIDKERDIQLFPNGGWHFNNIMSPQDISIKLKTFAHSEYSDNKFSATEIIRKKIEDRKDLFNRGYEYEKVDLDGSFPSI